MKDTKSLMHVSMLLSTLIVSLTLALSARAALEINENAYEVQVAQVQRWPLGEGDSLVVRPCRGCDTQTLQVTRTTEYTAGPDRKMLETINLPEILKLKTTLRNDPAHLILIFFNPESHQVNRLMLLSDF